MAINSVNYAHAILKGRIGGNPEEAAQFLTSMSPEERRQRNNSEGRLRARARKHYKPGHRKPWRRGLKL